MLLPLCLVGAALCAIVNASTAGTSTFSWEKLDEHKTYLSTNGYTDVADFTYKVLRPDETDSPKDPCQDLRVKIWMTAHLKPGAGGEAVLTIVRTDNVLKEHPMKAKGTRCAIDDEWLDVAGWPIAIKVVLCRASESSKCITLDIPENSKFDVMRVNVTKNSVLAPIKSEKQEIPRRTIRVTHDSADDKVAILDKVGKLIALQNPGYTAYEIFLDGLDARARSFDNELIQGQLTDIGTKTAKAMKNIQAIAYRVDVFRVAELYVHGGVYMDSKILPMRPLDALLPETGGYFPFDCDPNAIWNGFMAFPAGDPLPLRALERIFENIKNKYYGASALEPTGPLLVGHSWRDVKAKGSDNYKHDMQLSSNGIFLADFGTDERKVVVHNPEYRRHFLLSNMCHYTQLYMSRAVYYEAVCDPRFGLPWNTHLGCWDIRVRIISIICASLFAVTILALVIVRVILYRLKRRRLQAPQPSNMGKYKTATKLTK